MSDERSGRSGSDGPRGFDACEGGYFAYSNVARTRICTVCFKAETMHSGIPVLLPTWEDSALDVIGTARHVAARVPGKGDVDIENLRNALARFDKAAELRAKGVVA